MTYQVLTLCCSLLLFNACTNEPVPEKQALLLSPEELVRQWQNHIDNNRFEAAKKISSSLGTLEVEGIMKEIVDENFPDNFISKTVFESIQCEQYEKKAICICQVKEEEGRDSFFLVKENNYWLFEKLVFEELIDEDQMMDELQEDLDRLLEGEPNSK